MAKTYIIDFDSSLITLESLDELARIALADREDTDEVVAKLEDITDRGMSGEIGFDESLKQRLALFSANREHVEKSIELFKASISPSARANSDWFRNNADNIYVVSGGFEDYMLPITSELGLRNDHVFANRFTYDEAGNITGYDEVSLLSRPQGKPAQVKSLGLTDRKVIMIGDGYTDYEVLKYGAASEFWAFTETISRPKVIALADRVIHDFGEIV